MNANYKDEIYAAYKSVCKSKLILATLDTRIKRAMERGKDIEGMIELRIEIVLDGQVRFIRLSKLAVENKITPEDINTIKNQYLMEKYGER